MLSQTLGLAVLALPLLAEAKDCSTAAFQKIIPSNSTFNYVTKVAEGGTFTDAYANGNATGLPEGCAVSVKVPTPGNSSYNMAIYLPNKWNSRIITTGNGGYGGFTNWQDLGVYSHYGFSAITTDTGHDNANPLDSTFALNKGSLENWGWRAMHGSVLIGKALSAAYYGESHKYSYYSGCSTGGRQGLKEMQVSPEAFDGLFVGAPAWWIPHLGIYTSQATLGNLPQDSSHHISAALANVINDEILKQCDPLDGVTDNVIMNPEGCVFNPLTLLCEKASNTSSCITRPQLDTLYKALHDWTYFDGTLIFPAPSLGTPIAAYIGDSPNPNPMGTGMIEHMLLNTTAPYDWSTFNESVVRLAEAIDPDMSANEKSSGVLAAQVPESPSDDGASKAVRKPTWYRSTFWNASILGICNFLAPGIWGAMNSLGGGGQQSSTLVNTANALTFCLMVVTCFFSSAIVRWVGVKWALIIGTLGYCPYAAGLYVNNRYGDGWFVLLGAALCGLSAGIFWSVEAAIALAYPEPHNQGRFLGFWLSFRLGGQILGGAINLGVNVHNNKAGAVSYHVFEAFIALQALAPFAGLLLSPPEKVQRTDGLPVRLSIGNGISYELKEMAKLFVSKRFLLVVPLIAQAVYAEAVFFTFQGLWFSVRARALGSFLSGIVAVTMGNFLGRFLDSTKFSLKARSRGAFATILGLQGAWWIWATVLVTEFDKTDPTYDWVDAGFGKGFALFLFWVAGFQLNYLFLYFVVGNLAASQEELIRICSLLRGTESAVQAVSYGLGSVTTMARTGNIYLNFALWGLSLLPAWLVVREIGVSLGDTKVAREGAIQQDSD